MTSTTKMNALGMAAGCLWAVLVLWVGVNIINVPVFSRQLVAPFYLFAPGLVVLAMIARVGARAIFDDALINGADAPIGSPAHIDTRVLRNTVEQAVLAACLWPAMSFILLEDGPGIVLALSFSFVIARILFWAGYHLSPPLRAFGFAATLCPTILALIYCVFWWAMT